MPERGVRQGGKIALLEISTTHDELILHKEMEELQLIMRIGT